MARASYKNKATQRAIEKVVGKRVEKYIEEYVERRKEKKLGGPLLWILLTVTILQDLADPIVDLLLLAIQIIPVVGQALGVVVGSLNAFLGLSIAGINFFYLFANRGSFLSRKVGKAKFWLFKSTALMLADSIPILGMLPFTTLAFWYAVKTINKGREKYNKELSESFDS